MKYIIVLFSIVLTSCASYQAFEKDTSRPAQNRLKKQTKDGLVMAAEDFSATAKSVKYFDEDLKRVGYVPIFLCLSNQGKDEFTVRLQDMTLVYEDGTTTKHADVDTVIYYSQSWPIKSFLALPLFIIPVPFIWASISEANFQLDEDYRKKALSDGHVTPGDNIFGFVFFEVPSGKTYESLKDAILKIKADKKAPQGGLGGPVNFTLSISQD